jgi:CBS domain-containing protein
MSLQYKRITIYSSENVQYQGKLLDHAIIDYLRGLHLAARCIVNRGTVGYYENGEISTAQILDLSYNLPLRIEILIPSAELETVLPVIEKMVVDGIVAVDNLEVRSYHSTKSLIPGQLKVQEIMTSSPKTVTRDTPVGTVVNVMLENSLKGMVVVDREQYPKGMITSGDLMRKAGLPIRLGLLQKLDSNKVNAFIESVDGKTAGDIMSAPLITVKEADPVKEAVRVMIAHRLKRLPVVAQSGILVGIISRIDIFQSMTSQAPRWHSLQQQKIVVNNTQPVRAVTERDQETVYPETPIQEVIEKIAGAEIQRVAVIDKQGKLIGLISDSDLMPLLSGQPGFWDYIKSKLARTEKGRGLHEFVQRTHLKIASEVMVKDPVSIQEEATIDEAVKLMAEKGLKRLPVVDECGVFKGMIRRDSVLQVAAEGSCGIKMT